MNKRLPFFIIALFMFVGEICSAQVTVFVHKADNSIQTYNMDASGELQFVNDRLLITESALTEATTALNVDDIRKVTFSGATSSILTPQQRADFSLFPNPAQRSFSISGIGTRPASVAIFSVTGKLMFEQACADGSSIDVSHLKRGIYFVKINSQTSKLIIN